MRKMTSIFLISCLLLLTGCKAQEEKAPLPEKVEINYFYNEACASCEEHDVFWKMVREELGDAAEKYPYQANVYNVFKTEGASVRDAVFANLGFDQKAMQALSYPVMTINGTVYYGDEEIKASLREAYLTAGEDIFVNKRGVYDPAAEQTFAELTGAYPVQKDASTVVYFYRTVCEECIQTDEEIISKLPEKIKVKGEEMPLQVIRINTRSGRNAEIIREFFSVYQVPEEDQMVPIVFTASGYLAGYDKISASLITELENGAGLDFIMPKKD